MSERLSNVIRRRFVEYFTVKHNHKFVPSSPVLPKHDKSVSFVNAGMHQFKTDFIEDRVNYAIPRICNYQKCIRVGGKSGDLDQVGHSFRHHTFFEMLGNWSFNDYGKQEACEWALDFLVNQLKLDETKITTTYFVGPDEEDSETREIWLKLGISPNRIISKGLDDNFWEMGSHGPCGPSSEIFYPTGGSGDDLLELWNLVFIDRHKLENMNETLPLKSKFVDTGMGLERVVSVMENVKSNYDTDLFEDHFKHIHSKSNVEAYGGSLTDKFDINYRKLADHSRMIAVALADGVEPGRKGNEYLLRSIIKKSLYISSDIFGQKEPRYLLFDLVDATVNSLSEAYPELQSSVKDIRRIIAHESKRYLSYRRNDAIRYRGKDLVNIKQFLRMSPNNLGNEPDASFCLHGRICNFRSYKKFHFVDLVDGSTRELAQVVVDRSILEKPQIGSYLSCKGKITASKGKGQSVEFQVDKLIFHGLCDPEEYPLATIHDDSAKALRSLIHLRPRSPKFTSLLRVRSELEMAFHMIMKQMDFIRVHTPIITSNDSEATSDLFSVNRTKIMPSFTAPTFQPSRAGEDESKAGSDICNRQGVDIEGDDDEDDYVSSGHENTNTQSPRQLKKNYFNKDVFLVSSAQLHLECLASSLSRVYTLSPAFRAENSQTRRHLSEFMMFEAEEANIFELNPLMDRVETIVKFVAQYLTQVSEHSTDAMDLIEHYDNGRIYDTIANSEFIRIDYKTALNILREKVCFSGVTDFGCDISREHEKKLLEYHNNTPIFITHYPKRLKPFYMKTTGRKEAMCFDLIAPHGGEICGGSLREDDSEQLIRNIDKRAEETSISGSFDNAGGRDNFDWYIDTRRFGTFPHGGFGIGFERLIQSMLGIKNIKDTIPFPRWSGRCPM